MFSSSLLPYDIAGSVIGKPTNGAVLTRFIANRAFTIPGDLTDSRVSATNASTSGSTFVLKKNGANFGTIVWGAAAFIPTLTSSATTFAKGDVLTIEQQGSADATLADIQYTIAATLN